MMNANRSLENFIDFSEQHGYWADVGNTGKINEYHDNLIETIKSIRNNDPELTILVPLLQHENDSVKSWAATYLLPYNESESIAVLENISRKKGWIAFSAEMVLKEWRKGRLKFAA